MQALSEVGIEAKLIHISKIDKFFTRLRRLITDPSLLRVFKKFYKYSAIERIFADFKIDLAYAVSPSNWPLDLSEINYITTVWDLSHRDDPEFPEVRWNRQLESRDHNYRLLLPRALAIFVDSEFGKKNVVHRYGIDEERVYVMPFQAALATRTHNSTDNRTSKTFVKNTI